MDILYPRKYLVYIQFLLNLVSNQDWFEFHGNLIRDRKISGP